MLELYGEVLEAAGLDVHMAVSLDEVPLRCADVAVLQLHPRDDASRAGRALRSRTECQLLIALVAFHAAVEPGVFDHIALVPLSPTELLAIICSLAPC